PAFGDPQPPILARGTAQPPTLDGLLNALRDDYEMLIIVAHGTLVQGEPYLWLERSDGRAEKVTAAVLVERIREARHRPLLTILAACEGAGREGDEAPLAALGPLLVAAGVPAV